MFCPTSVLCGIGFKGGTYALGLSEGTSWDKKEGRASVCPNMEKRVSQLAESDPYRDFEAVWLRCVATEVATKWGGIVNIR